MYLERIPAQARSLKQWTLEHDHLPNCARNEDRVLLNRYKFNAKFIKQGKLLGERGQMILDLENMRNSKVYGGHKKKSLTLNTRIIKPP